ncbi:MAG: tRNA modification GTPase MnmE [Bacteroidia bacterium]|nr:MAG: tRNA modification GTPase MnmE [Bacteroidia bacterium]
MLLQNSLEDTIVAISSPYGMGGVAVIRCSGKLAFNITQQLFFKKKFSKWDLKKIVFRKMYYGIIIENENVIDDVMVCFFQSPHSYTGEDVVEIYCHGSIYVQQKILQLYLNKGARLANAGEFTIRAYLNGKLNLSEAEAIGDLIHAETEAEHRLAIDQLRGGYKNLIEHLREQLLNFASLIELELDFSEEDVEFANRTQLIQLLQSALSDIEKLTESFQMGNAIKTGIPVVILGKPNAGKSTLLNALLNEEKAIVSEIPGTTRDLIEDKLIINGIAFRIIDTAGIREAKDEIEKIGIERAQQSIQKAMIVILLQDISKSDHHSTEEYIQMINSFNPNAVILKVYNKIDKLNEIKFKEDDSIYISAKEKINIDVLKQKLFHIVLEKGYQPHRPMVTNVRHFNELNAAKKFLNKALNDLKTNVSTELIAEDLKFAIHHLSNITGNITSEDILKNIFSKFCIGK